MFGVLSSQERETLRTFMEDSGRVLALVSADNARFQEAIASGLSAEDAAHLQYYLHKISFIDQANLQDEYGAFGEPEKVIRSESSSQQLLINTEIFFSRLRHLWLTGSDVFPVADGELSHWKRLVEQAWSAQQNAHERSVKRSKVQLDEWRSRLVQLEREADHEVPNIELARVEARIADLLWEAAVVWALAVAEEAGNEQLSDKLLAYGLAATCTMRFWFDSEQDEATALRHLNLLSAAAAEDALQRFHRSVITGRISPSHIGTVVGFVAGMTAKDARGLYRRYVNLDGPEAVASDLQQSLTRILGSEVAEVATTILLEDDRA